MLELTTATYHNYGSQLDTHKNRYLFNTILTHFIIGSIMMR